ncbi:RNA polymerase sigma-70 factor (ECF subfamily) [Peribacillus deserti]|uniref:RNA polymerase sigma-70 factor (ECF subfamily) n=1 Tax=Peribacillus deserti TaxID=673318 RepID=A0ABS2QMG7_9BACI|nr:sigma-70 family RNA polymerase sigma factor [Peribacillus deserti]MBM7694302.1 RNA polymerase sigma-70 factor (ECF subfamily) [Peribacillus deserti]
MPDPLEEVYQAYKNPVFHYLYNMCRNRTTAEELTHDTFIKAIKGYGQFRGESSLKLWLFKIARNTYLNNARKFSQKNEIPYAEPELQVSGTTWNIDTEMMVRQTLHKLTEKERTLLVLREQGFSLSEMADILVQTEGSIKVGIHRAKKKFKEYYLEGEGERK